MSPRITALAVHDVRFPTSDQLDGSDAMNPDPDYSAAYVVLRTDIVGQHGTDALSMLRTYGTTDLGRLEVTDAQLAAVRSALPASVHDRGTFGGAVLYEL